MRLVMQGARLFASDAGGVRVFDVSQDEPEQLGALEMPGLVCMHTLHGDGEQLSAAAGAVARLFVGGEGASDWFDGQSRIAMLDGDLNVAAIHETGALLNGEALALSPDGAMVAGALHGEGVVVFDARTGAQLYHAEGEISSGVAWSPDGRLIAAGDTDQGDGELYLLELGADGVTTRHKLPNPASRAPLYDSPFAAAWSPDGASVAFGSVAWGMRGIVVYDVAARVERWSLGFALGGGDEDEEQETWEALDVAFVAGGAVVVTGLEGGLRAWRAVDGAPLTTLGCEEATTTRFAVDDARRRVWFEVDGAPVWAAFPDDWR